MNEFINTLNDQNAELSVSLEVTHRCNLKCTYCFQEKAECTDELSVDEWVLIVRALNSVFKNVIQYKIVGGEVFQKESVIDIMRVILESGSKLTTITNGIKVPESFFELYASNPNRSFLEISMDGLNSINNRHRGGYKHAKHSLQIAMKEGLPVALRVNVYKTNAPHISDFISKICSLREYARSQPKFYFQPLFRTAENPNDIHIELEQYFEIAQDIKNRHAEIDQHWRIVDRKAFKRDYRNMGGAHSQDFGCDTGATLVIKPNGDFSGCELEPPRGNIIQYIENLASLAEKVAKINSPSSMCTTCVNAKKCGACRLAPLLHNYPNTFGFNSCVEYTQQIEKFREFTCLCIELDQA